MDSLDGSRASVLMGSTSATPALLSQPHLPVVVPRCLGCLILRTWLARSPIPCLYVPFPRRLSDLAAASSQADSAAEVPIPRFPPPFALVSGDSDDEVLIPRPTLSCVPSTSLPFLRPVFALQASGRARPWPMPSWVWLILICIFL
jgi:hypothetical protein